MRTPIFAIVACLIAAPAGAQLNRDLIKEYDPQLWPIQIEFVDGITDGCLPRPGVIKTTMELGLRRAGLRPTDQISPWRFLVDTTGKQLGEGVWSDTCIASVTVSLDWSRWFYEVNSEQGYYLRIPVFFQFGIVHGSRSTMQRSLNNAVREIVDQYANEILKAMEQ